MVKRRGLRDYLLAWRIGRTEDRMIEDSPPQPVFIVGANDGADAVPSIVNAAGEVTEVNSAGLNNQAGNQTNHLRSGMPLVWRADGVLSAADAWVPIIPILVTADGAGLPPATVIVPLNAGDQIDVMIFMTNATISGAGMHEYNFRTDPLAAVGGISPVVPAMVATIIPSPANGTTPGHTYGHRMITDVVSSAFGIADGANADWPNAETVLFTGFYRYI